MERLTRWNERTESAELTAYDDYEWDEFEISVLLDDVDYVRLQSAFDKLAEYEDAEEQGLLLRLPCKVGDTLYCVGTECHADIVPDEECDLLIDCDECGHNKKWVVFERTATKYLIGVLMGYGMLSNFEYKKNVFLTREEAEAALEKMKGKEHERSDK